MDNFVLIFIAADIVLLPVLLYLIFKVFRPMMLEKQRQSLEDLARSAFHSEDFEVEAQTMNLFGFELQSHNVLRVRKNGAEFAVSASPGSKNSPARTQIFLAANSSCPLSVVKENVMHGVGKRFGLTSELEFGDPSLDKAFFFQSSDEIRAREFGSQSEFRNLLQELLKDKRFGEFRMITPEQIEHDQSLRYTRLALDRPGLLLTRNDYVLGRDEFYPTLQREVEGMIELAGRL